MGRCLIREPKAGEKWLFQPYSSCQDFFPRVLDEKNEEEEEV